MKKIRKNIEFSSIYNNSKKVYTRYAVIFICPNDNNEQRFGFVASRKTGNAVRRNRIKRLFKEFVIQNRKKLKKNKDYIFVGKSILKTELASLKYKDIEEDIIKVISK